jgi:hypothetical protein
VTSRLLRRTTSVPSSASSWRIATLSGGCAMCGPRRAGEVELFSHRHELAEMTQLGRRLQPRPRRNTESI